MLEKGEHATKEWYDETQKIPERIEGATKGKEWVKDFMWWCQLRHDVEHPEDAERYQTDALYRYSETMNLFQKYLVEQIADVETGKNSICICYAEGSDGNSYLWHNLLGVGSYKTLRGVFLRLTRVCHSAMCMAKKKK